MPPASPVLASERVHGPLTLAHNNRESTGVLTEGSKLAGRDAVAPAVRSGRWSRAALSEESKEGVSRRLSSTAGCGVVLRGWTVGQGGPRTTGGEGIPGRSGSPELSSGRNSGEVGPDVGDGGLGGVPGAQANLLRWLGLAVERRSTAGTAAQGARCGGAERGGALGLVRLRQGDVGCGRGPGRV